MFEIAKYPVTWALLALIVIGMLTGQQVALPGLLTGIWLILCFTEFR